MEWDVRMRNCGESLTFYLLYLFTCNPYFSSIQYILFLVDLFSEEHDAEVHEEDCEDASPETSAAPHYCLKHRSLRRGAWSGLGSRRGHKGSDQWPV